MKTRRTRIQLAIFTIVTVLAVAYGSVQYLGAGKLVRPPYEITVQLASPGGIYPGADVDLLGTVVGSVRSVDAGPKTATTLTLEIDQDVDIPRDVTAGVRSKSAIGEQYVALYPGPSAAGGTLAEGDVIGLEDTTSPVDVASLLANTYGLVDSVPLDDLAVVLSELSAGLAGTSESLGRIIDDVATLSRKGLDNVDDLTALIDNAAVVLDTQVDHGEDTQSAVRNLALLTTELRQHNDDFARLFATGTVTAVQTSDLLVKTRPALTGLLRDTLTLVTVVEDRVPALRKTLVMFPRVLELEGTMTRFCGEHDPRTGRPVEATCRRDSSGKPIYAAYLGMQLPELPLTPPYFPCTQGYEATVKYLPNGMPLEGSGPRQGAHSKPNYLANCTASPGDRNTPNVRGSQNVPRGPLPGTSSRVAAFDPQTSRLMAPEGTYDFSAQKDPVPSSGPGALDWLMNGILR
jgi:phospholipid/cholesterol/gamma-HCH transport system substrate-binding protein